MGLIALEHSKAAYWADFAAYGVAIVVSSVALPFFGPQGSWPALVALASLGFAGWTLVEYGMHRFVLHGIEPFRRWHDAHHQRPVALISAPTFLSVTLIATLVFLPSLLALGRWHAAALTLGLTAGYLAYGVTHHATPHWRAGNGWMKHRTHWHALHHHAGGAWCYGVSISFWDRVFGSMVRCRP